MTPAALGMLVGALLGIAAAVDGFAGFAIALLLVAVGFGIGKVVSGDVDVAQYVSSAERKISRDRP